MPKSAAADRFADNVVKRSEYDLVIRTRLMFLLAFLPFLIALIGLLILKGDSNIDIIADNLLLISSELCIISFMLFLMSYRTYKHEKRDAEWMDALMDYVEFKGGDTSRMKAHRDSLHAGFRRVSMYISGGLLGFNILYLVLIGVYLYLHIDIVSNHMVLLSVVSFILVGVQFIVTSGSTVFLPNHHDKIQSQFTEELKFALGQVGVNVSSMPHTIRKRNILIHLFLFVMTLGFYIILLLFESSIKLNRHLYSQWDYEVDLLSEIMEAEGASGIGPVSK